MEMYVTPELLENMIKLEEDNKIFKNTPIPNTYETRVLFWHEVILRQNREYIKQIAQEVSSTNKRLEKIKDKNKAEQLKDYLVKLINKNEEITKKIEALEKMEEKDFINSLSNSIRTSILKLKKKEPTENDIRAKQKRIAKRRKKKGYK